MAISSCLRDQAEGRARQETKLRRRRPGRQRLRRSKDGESGASGRGAESRKCAVIRCANVRVLRSCKGAPWRSTGAKRGWSDAAADGAQRRRPPTARASASMTSAPARRSTIRAARACYGRTPSRPRTRPSGCGIARRCGMRSSRPSAARTPSSPASSFSPCPTS